MDAPLKSDATVRERPTSVRYLVLAWLCVAAAIAYLQRNCIGVAESTIRSDLGFSKDLMGWLLSGFFWTYAIFQIPSGWLGDRLGSRLTLPLYSGIWSLATLFSALAGTVLTVWLAEASGFAGLTLFVAWQWLVMSRMLAGASQAGIFPCSAIIVSDWFPQTRRALSTGWLACFMQVGGVTATFLTGWLLEIINWRWVFLIYGLPGFVWAIAFYRWFRDRPREHSSVNAAEAALIAENAQQNDPTSADKPIGSTPWLALLASPPMWWICGQQFCRAFAYIFYATWFPTFLQESRGVSIPTSGVLTSLPLLAGLIGAPLGGTISDWILVCTGSRRLAKQAMASTVLAGSAVVIFVAYFVQEPVQAVLTISAGAFCASLAGPISYSTTVDMGGRHVATVFGTMNMSGNLGAAIFPIVVPLLLGENNDQQTGNWDLVFFTFCGVYLAAALFWLLLKPYGTVFDQSLIKANRTDVD